MYVFSNMLTFIILLKVTASDFTERDLSMHCLYRLHANSCINEWDKCIIILFIYICDSKTHFDDEGSF